MVDLDKTKHKRKAERWVKLIGEDLKKKVEESKRRKFNRWLDLGNMLSTV